MFQADLDSCLHRYNLGQSHLGYRNQGRRPMETINSFVYHEGLKGRLMAVDRRNLAVPLILLAGWINLKIFLFSPLTIYITNAGEMQVEFHILLLLYFIPFLVSMAILIFLGLALPPGFRHSYVAVLAAIGVLLWLQSDVLLWGYGPLDGTFIDWQREAWKGYVDTPIWVAVLVAAVYWRRRLLPMVQSFCLLLFAVQVGSLWFMEPDPRIESGERTGRLIAHLDPPKSSSGSQPPGTSFILSWTGFSRTSLKSLLRTPNVIGKLCRDSPSSKKPSRRPP